MNNVINPDDNEHNGDKVNRKTVKKVNTENNTATIKTKKAGDIYKNVKVVPAP